MSKFECLNDDERELVKNALSSYEALQYEAREFDDMAETEELIREIDRLGDDGERNHDENCPHLYAVGHVQADIPCPECDRHGWHPTKVCQNCDYSLCWCVSE